MTPRAIFEGGLHPRAAAVPGALAAAGFTLGAGTGRAAWLALSGVGSEAEQIIQAATEAAAAGAAEQILVLLPGEARVSGDWPADRAAALLSAFVRSAAFAWAARDIRVNALGFEPIPGVSASAESVAAAALLLCRSRAATGQVLRLAR